MKKFLVPLIIIIVSLLVFFVLQITKPEKRVIEAAENRPLISVERLQRESASAQISVIGQVVSQDISPLLSPAELFVEAVNAQVGQRVTQGQSLVQLDISELKLQQLQLEADIQAINSEMNNLSLSYRYNKQALNNEKKLVSIAERNVDRANKLAQTQAGSQAALDNATELLQQRTLALQQRLLSIEGYDINKTAIQARLNKAQANLALLESDIQRAKVTAPFDGYITQMNISQGQRLNRNQVMLQMYKESSLEFKAPLPLHYSRLLDEALRKQQVVIAENDSLQLNLTLSRLAAQVESNQVGINAYFQIDNADQVRLGEVLEIRLNLPKQDDVFTLPLDALYEQNQIYLVTNNRLKQMPVERIGQYTDQAQNIRVIVRSKLLQEGDEILTSRLPQAINGLEIEIVGK